ncbi:hypothetical protein D3C79_483420 [compost metagenome]
MGLLGILQLQRLTQAAHQRGQGHVIDPLQRMGKIGMVLYGGHIQKFLVHGVLGGRKGGKGRMFHIRL